MSHRHADSATVVHDAPLLEAQGDAPPAAPGLVSAQRSKDARKRHKRELKRLRDAERPPDAFERFRVLTELVRQGHQLIDIVDHRARYALIILGALNAGVMVVMSRWQVLNGLAPNTRLWFYGGMGIYVALTSLCVYFAVECLRPRRIYEGDVNARIPIHGGPDARHMSRGILFWETVAAYDLDGYREAWSATNMDQLNAEVVSLAHRQSRLIRAKYAVLRRLFNGLVLLLVLGSLLLGAGALIGVAR